MKEETKIVLKTLRDFLASDELKRVVKPVTLPNIDKVPKALRGKTIPVPLHVALNEFFKRKVDPKWLATILDQYSDVVAIFLMYMKKNLSGWEYSEEVSVEDLKKLAEDKK